MNGTINIICYKSKKLSNGQHPLMVRVCKNDKVKYQSIGISVNSEQWDFQKNRPKPNCPNPDKPEPKRGKTLPLYYENNNGKIQRQDIIRIVML
jgi:hypothetical protein